MNTIIANFFRDFFPSQVRQANSIEFDGTVFHVGDKVIKKSGKPFKSKNKTNTIKSITINPYSNQHAFTFNEDSSIVDIIQLEKL